MKRAYRRKRLRNFNLKHIDLKDPRLAGDPESQAFHGMLLQNINYLDGRHFGDGATTGHANRGEMRDAMFVSYDRDSPNKPMHFSAYGRKIFLELSREMKLDGYVERLQDQHLGKLPVRIAQDSDPEPSSRPNRLSFEQWQERAQKGDARAHYMMGIIPRKGRTAEQRFGLFERALELGFAPASARVAEFLIRGVGTDKDPERAVSMLNRVGEAGYPGAYFFLGALYGGASTFKSNVVKDNHAAVRNYQACIKLDGKVTQYKAFSDFALRRCYTNLGRHYMLGNGVEKNMINARRYFGRGVELGEPIAMYYLAFRYIFGEGGKPDFNRGIALLNQSADLGNKAALRSIRKLEKAMKKELRRPSGG
jgi:TPR repeat protein